MSEADAALVRAAQHGDADAWNTLYANYARLVHGVVLLRVPRDAVADIVQEVFLQAFRSASQVRDPAAFPAWLASIARRRAADWRRRRHATEQLSEQWPAELRDADAPVDAERALAAIRALPEAYRETLVLRLVEGLTGPEIATQTGLQPGSVRVNLHRGMKLLREKLGWENEDGS